jgi:hypothetical protein
VVVDVRLVVVDVSLVVVLVSDVVVVVTEVVVLVKLSVVVLTVSVVLEMVVVVEEVGVVVGEVVGVVRMHSRNPPSAYDETAAFNTAASASHPSVEVLAMNVLNAQPSVPTSPLGPVNAKIMLFKSAAAGPHVPPPPPEAKSTSLPSAVHFNVEFIAQLANNFCIHATSASQAAPVASDDRR